MIHDEIVLTIGDNYNNLMLKYIDGMYVCMYVCMYACMYVYMYVP